jgi:hypothetical protein
MRFRLSKFHSENKSYLIVDWDLSNNIYKSGESPYNAVNLRKIGLKQLIRKKTERICLYTLKKNNELIDLRKVTEIPNYYWEIFEIIDKQKFFLARIRLGF